MTGCRGCGILQPSQGVHSMLTVALVSNTEFHFRKKVRNGSLARMNSKVHNGSRARMEVRSEKSRQNMSVQ